MEPNHESSVADFQERSPVLKALVVGNTSPSNVRQPDGEQSAFTEAGALAPPHDPATLCMLLEHSNALRQNIDAYQNNIDGFGNRYEPIIDPTTDDGLERIANAMFIDATEAGTPPEEAWPTEEEVDEKAEWLRREMRIEKAKLKNFFDFCCPDASFISHRKHTRQDMEVMGNGYWEVLRNKKEDEQGLGAISQFVFIPGHTMRLLPMTADDYQSGEMFRPVSELTHETVPIKKQFRRYIQALGFGRSGGTQGQVVYFKELHDPRIISASSGRTYATEEAMQTAEAGTRQATEILHFKIHSPRSSYGVPRWIGALLCVLGNRQAEEVNFMYFENKGVPPLAILVSGGRMTDNAVDKITDFIDNEIRGKKNFHKILVLEADSDGPANSGKTKIEIKPLTDAQQKDGLFQEYDARNIDKVGQAFRLPRMLRGDIRDFNRSTAEAALIFAEMQVFQPEREDFDWTMNRKILPALGIRFWKFASMGPVTKDQKQLAEIVSLLVRSNIITPGEARVLAEDVINKDLPKIEEFWAEQPVILTQQGFIPTDDLVRADEQEGATPSHTQDGNLADGKLSADASTSDLATGGGANNGGQRRKKPRRRFERLPPLEKLDDVVSQAQRLVLLRETVKLAESDAAEEAFLRGKADYEDELSNVLDDDS